MARHPLAFILTIALGFSLTPLRFVADASDTISSGPETVQMGLVSSKPRERIREHLDLINYVASRLVPGGKGKVVVASDPGQMAKLIQEKAIDFYLESAYATFLINERTGAKVLLRRWKDGVAEYSTLLLTRSDSGITRLNDLLGKVVAFEDPGSSSGYFVPKAFLIKKGFKLAEKSSFEEPVSSREIGYVFSHGSEKNIINWVLLRKVAAGALNSSDFEKLSEKRKSEFSILAETETLPRHVLSVRKDMDATLSQRLKAILLAMHQDEAGRKALRKADKTSKFDLFPDGDEMVYRKIRELFRVVPRSKP